MNNIKLLFNIFEHYDKETHDKKYSELYNELSKIFSELMNDKNISIEKRSKLRKETIDTARKIYTFFSDDFIDYHEDVVNKTKRLRLLKGTSIIIFILRLLIIPIIIFKPSLFFILIIMLTSFNIYLSSPKRMNETKIIQFDEFYSEIQKMDILLGNCGRRLNLNLEVSDEHSNDKDIENIELANNVILNFIETREVSQVSPEIKEIVVKILQDDLKTTKSNFLDLLCLAKEKVEKESLIKGKELKK